MAHRSDGNTSTSLKDEALLFVVFFLDVHVVGMLVVTFPLPSLIVGIGGESSIFGRIIRGGDRTATSCSVGRRGKEQPGLTSS